MKRLRRTGKLLVGAALIVAGAVVGLNPKWELRKLWARGGPKKDPEANEETKPLY